MINKAGIDLIEEFEGCSLKAYPDPATGGEPITIGYGHTGGVKLGDVITQEEADQLLIDDLVSSERCIDDNVKVELTENQRAALVSLVFNIGSWNFENSTLLKKLNASDYTGAAAEFVRWNRANKQVMAGLTRRREAEAKLFLTE